MPRFDTPEGKIPMPVLSILVMGVVIAFMYILPIAFEREERRLEIVRQTHCQQYGDAMNEWARREGLEQPCQN